MKKRTHHYSLALRLFSSVILGMLALNILTIYSTQRLGESAEENILREYRQVQVLYANEVEREMSEAQGRITDVSCTFRWLKLDGEQIYFEDIYSIEITDLG